MRLVRWDGVGWGGVLDHWCWTTAGSSSRLQSSCRRLIREGLSYSAPCMRGQAPQSLCSLASGPGLQSWYVCHCIDSLHTSVTLAQSCVTCYSQPTGMSAVPFLVFAAPQAHRPCAYRCVCRAHCEANRP